MLSSGVFLGISEMSDENKKRPGDVRCGVEFLAGVICLAVSIYVMCKSITFWKEDYAVEFYYSAGLMPMIIGIALLAFSLVYVIRTIKDYSLKACIVDIKNFVVDMAKSKLVHKSIVGLVIMWIYIYLLLGKIIFWVATFVTLAALLIFMNWEKPMSFKKILKFLAISIVGTGLIVLVFSVIFKVPLP